MSNAVTAHFKSKQLLPFSWARYIAINITKTLQHVQETFFEGIVWYWRALHVEIICKEMVLTVRLILPGYYVRMNDEIQTSVTLQCRLKVIEMILPSKSKRQ